MDKATSNPHLTISTSAADAFRTALGTSGNCVYLTVNSEYEASLDIAEFDPELLKLEIDGVVFLLDDASMSRADGITIDYKSGAMSGFSIDNPNAPAKVVEIDAKELKARLDSQEFVHFFDVRTLEERELALISGTRLLDDAAVTHIESLDRGTALVFH